VSWSHETVYRALASKYGVNSAGALTWLYPQTHDCAVLYSPDSKTRSRPLHLNPGRPDWDKDIYREILPAIESVNLEQRSAHDRKRSFLLCTVREGCWGIIATALDLHSAD
jgi:hypothetical protein